MFFEEIKAGLHQDIEACNDEQRLQAVRAVLAADSSYFDALSPEVQKDILTSMAEAKSAQTTSWDDFIAERASW